MEGLLRWWLANPTPPDQPAKYKQSVRSNFSQRRRNNLSVWSHKVRFPKDHFKPLRPLQVEK